MISAVEAFFKFGRFILRERIFLRRIARMNLKNSDQSLTQVLIYMIWFNVINDEK